MSIPNLPFYISDVERLGKLSYPEKFKKVAVYFLMFDEDNNLNLSNEQIQASIDNLPEKCPRCDSNEWWKGTYTDDITIVCGACQVEAYYPDELFG